MLPCLSLLHLLALSCFLSVHHLVKVPKCIHHSWWTFFSQSAIHVCWFGLEAYPAYATLKHTRRVYINPSQSVSAGEPSPDSLASASLPPPPARTGASPPAWQVAQSIPTIVKLCQLSRQQDVASRVEWLWRERLRGEEEGVETVQGINRLRCLDGLRWVEMGSHESWNGIRFDQIGWDGCWDGIRWIKMGWVRWNEIGWDSRRNLNLFYEIPLGHVSAFLIYYEIHQSAFGESPSQPCGPPFSHCTTGRCHFTFFFLICVDEMCRAVVWTSVLVTMVLFLP